MILWGTLIIGTFIYGTFICGTFVCITIMRYFYMGHFCMQYFYVVLLYVVLLYGVIFLDECLSLGVRGHVTILNCRMWAAGTTAHAQPSDLKKKICCHCGGSKPGPFSSEAGMVTTRPWVVFYSKGYYPLNQCYNQEISTYTDKHVLSARLEDRTENKTK